MKLWLLRPVTGLSPKESPWEPWYDKAFGFVVRADTESEARTLAQKDGGDEVGRYSSKLVSAWSSSKFSTCVELTAEGEAGVIMKDFASA